MQLFLISGTYFPAYLAHPLNSCVAEIFSHILRVLWRVSHLSNRIVSQARISSLLFIKMHEGVGRQDAHLKWRKNSECLAMLYNVSTAEDCMHFFVWNVRWRCFGEMSKWMDKVCMHNVSIYLLKKHMGWFTGLKCFFLR